MLICVKFGVRIGDVVMAQHRFVNARDDSEEVVLKAVSIAMNRVGGLNINEFTWQLVNGDVWAIQGWLDADGTPKPVVDVIGHMLFFTGER